MSVALLAIEQVPAISVDTFKAVIKARRTREALLPANLFADPAWDILLDLMVARLEGKRVCVSSLCIAACVPTTTALRWIGMMVMHGILVRISDKGDGRRAFIELSDETAAKMEQWARAIQ